MIAAAHAFVVRHVGMPLFSSANPNFNSDDAFINQTKFGNICRHSTSCACFMNFIPHWRKKLRRHDIRSSIKDGVYVVGLKSSLVYGLEITAKSRYARSMGG